jgi:hypothetical protein
MISCWTFSYKTASTPPWENRRRTFVTVASHTSKVSRGSALHWPRLWLAAVAWQSSVLAQHTTSLKAKRTDH